MTDLRDKLSYDALKLAVKAGHKGADAIAKAEAVLDVLTSTASVRVHRYPLPPDFPRDDAERETYKDLIDSQLSANARTGNEPLSGTETFVLGDQWRLRNAKGQVMTGGFPSEAVDGDRFTVSGIDFHKMDGKWHEIPKADVIGRNGDADVAKRLGMTDLDQRLYPPDYTKPRNPLDFDDYKPAGDEP